jgi:hypothetical protein
MICFFASEPPPLEDRLMPNPGPFPDTSELRWRPLLRLDDESGAIAAVAHESYAHVPDITNADLALLHVRVIALENLLITVLAEGSDPRRQPARDMVDTISLRSGFMSYLPSIQAVQHMNDLLDSAIHVRAVQP